MRVLETVALLIIAAGVFSFINSYFFRLPSTIGLLLSGLVASAAILALEKLLPSFDVSSVAKQLIGEIDFSRFLFSGVLSFLLFAGALHLDIDDLRRERWPVVVLASLGVVLSTAIVGFASSAVFRICGVAVPLAYCLVFGALISPTDPVAVLGIVKTLKASSSLQVRIAAESLFNDGFGVVVFTVLLELAGTRGHASGGGLLLSSTLLFAREVFGGLALGLGAGLIAYQAMKRINDPPVEVLLSFSLVLAITFVGARIETSSPLACVVAGLFIGNRGRRFAMEEPTRQAIDHVWSFVDSVLNAVLFLLLGLESLFLWSFGRAFLALLLLVPLVLAARWISVGAGLGILGRRFHFDRGDLALLTWGGLRGGISVAMALSLGPFPGRRAVLLATYGIVVFSILAQGLTIPLLARRILNGRHAKSAAGG
ncbi:MAG: cation:proton antiporter [Thermoanaerobaculia bacterium]